MKRHVVLDLETKKLFHEVKERRHSLLGVSVLGLYEGLTGSFKAFEEAKLAEAWPILENAELIIGYNIKKFDLPVLVPYYPGDIFSFPILDLYEVVKNDLGISLTLDSLAKATLGVSKHGTGLKAVQLYKDGKLEELKKYCLHDVKITKDLLEYALKHESLKYFDFGQVLKTFPVKISSWYPKRNAKTQMSLGV
jgi:DEAD/DEAH box helicase domain-containing protein